MPWNSFRSLRDPSIEVEMFQISVSTGYTDFATFSTPSTSAVELAFGDIPPTPCTQQVDVELPAKQRDQLLNSISGMLSPIFF